MSMTHDMIRLEDRQQAIKRIKTLWKSFAFYGFPRGEETPVSDTEMVESEFLRLDWCRVCLSLLALTGRPPLSHANEKEPKPRANRNSIFFGFHQILAHQPSAELKKKKIGSKKKKAAVICRKNGAHLLSACEPSHLLVVRFQASG